MQWSEQGRPGTSAQLRITTPPPPRADATGRTTVWPRVSHTPFCCNRCQPRPNELGCSRAPALRIRQLLRCEPSYIHTSRTHMHKPNNEHMQPMSRLPTGKRERELRARRCCNNATSHKRNKEGRAEFAERQCDDAGCAPCFRPATTSTLRSPTSHRPSAQAKRPAAQAHTRRTTQWRMPQAENRQRATASNEAGGRAISHRPLRAATSDYDRLCETSRMPRCCRWRRPTSVDLHTEHKNANA